MAGHAKAFLAVMFLYVLFLGAFSVYFLVTDGRGSLIEGMSWNDFMLMVLAPVAISLVYGVTRIVAFIYRRLKIG
jgi:hypothetical protein